MLRVSQRALAARTTGQASRGCAAGHGLDRILLYPIAPYRFLGGFRPDKLHELPTSMVPRLASRSEQFVQDGEDTGLAVLLDPHHDLVIGRWL
jgi:hypothetical protein